MTNDDTPFGIMTTEDRFKLAIERIKATTLIAGPEDAATAGAILDGIKRMQAALKDASAYLTGLLIERSKAQSIKSEDIGGDLRIVYSTTPKYEIATDEICKRYCIPDTFKELLSSSAFKIGAIKASSRFKDIESGIDVSDCFAEVEPEVKAEIKPTIVNKRFLGGPK